MADFIPNGDLEFKVWLDNFVTYANANLAALGLVAGDMNPISTQQTNFGSSITDQETKRAALEAATQYKKERRAAVEALVRPLVKKLQANAVVTNFHKQSLGITVPDSIPSTPVPLVPNTLTARGLDSGTNVLSWKSNGNKPGTPYVIEAKIGASETWVLVDVITQTKYNHTGQTPGVKATYRIRARRSSQTSEPSEEATVYA